MRSCHSSSISAAPAVEKIAWRRTLTRFLLPLFSSMPSSIPSPTSEGSLFDEGEVGPTGTTNASSTSPSLWEAVRGSSKPSSSSQPQSGPQSPNGKRGSSAGSLFGWLTGLGSSSAGFAGAGAPTVPRIDTSERVLQTLAQARKHGDSVTASESSGGSSESSSCECSSNNSSSNLRALPREVETTSSKRDAAHRGVPRQVSTESSDSATQGEDLPDVNTTPHTASVVAASKARAAAMTDAPVCVQISSQPSPMLQRVPSAASTPSEVLPVAGPSHCFECGMLITGPVFMLHDLPYCCQRHRLTAYQKMEKDGRGAQAVASSQPPQTTGLRATFATWC